MSEIIKGLFLGSEEDYNIDFLLKKNIKVVIRVIVNEPEEYFDGIDFHHISIPDNSTVKIGDFFPYVNNIITKALQSNENVLIHCMAGISRSATLVIAFIMERNMLSWTEALQFVKDKRGRINPNIGFIGALLNYDKVLAKAS